MTGLWPADWSGQATAVSECFLDKNKTRQTAKAGAENAKAFPGKWVEVPGFG